MWMTLELKHSPLNLLFCLFSLESAWYSPHSCASFQFVQLRSLPWWFLISFTIHSPSSLSAPTARGPGPWSAQNLPWTPKALCREMTSTTGRCTRWFNPSRSPITTLPSPCSLMRNACEVTQTTLDDLGLEFGSFFILVRVRVVLNAWSDAGCMEDALHGMHGMHGMGAVRSSTDPAHPFNRSLSSEACVPSTPLGAGTLLGSCAT